MTSAGIEFELTRKRVKNINLRIHPPDGRVTVAAPLRTSEAHHPRKLQAGCLPYRPSSRASEGDARQRLQESLCGC